jgi:uncharacterized secreted protein with C-terminal beta-propeller domain
VKIMNVSNPRAPREVAFHNFFSAVYSVAISGSYAFVAAGTAGLRILDVGNPAAPVEIGAYDTPGHALDVALVGDFACVADFDGGLRVLDVSDPAAPVEVASYPSRDLSWSVAASTSAIVSAAGYDGLYVFDFLPAFDPDGDVISNRLDNCPDASNPAQEDFDMDGMGDACESGAVLADADRSGRVDGIDLARLGRSFGSACGEARYDATVDYDRSCTVTGDDLAILAATWGTNLAR